MNILCFDTATDACSVALQVGEQRFARHEIAPRLHSQLLLPMIQSLITEAKITIADLHAIAFGCGPGSFMGVRLATGIAQGLAFGLSIPIIPISTLQVIAQAAYEKTGAKQIVSGWDARMQEVYWGKYVCDENNIMQSQQEDALCTVEKIDKDSFIALGFHFAGNIFSDDTYPSAIAMLTIAKQKYSNQDVVSSENAHPHYVRHHVVHHHN